jgi:hypothetical protein
VSRKPVWLIALHKCGKSDSHIFKLLKPLKISGYFVYRAIKRYKELWGVEDRARSGRLKSVRSEAAIRTVGERIRRNPLWKQMIMSRELNTSTQSSCAASGTIYTRSHLRSKGHLLIPALKEIRRIRAERLLQWHAENGHENILFTDEKFFTIAEQYNNQNIMLIMLKRPLRCILRVQGCHHPSYVTVWWEVSHQG